jgi:hypothetical protein
VERPENRVVWAAGFSTTEVIEAGGILIVLMLDRDAHREGDGGSPRRPAQ